MKPLLIIGTALYILCTISIGAQDAGAQSGEDAFPDEREATLKAAGELSAAGRFDDVVVLLESYVDGHPNDADAWILLARHRYWTDDHSAAERDFERALALHPDHDGLRLAYAQFLSETDRLRAAARVIGPVRRDDSEAHALKGRIAWWRGDLTSAKRHFERALRQDHGNDPASRGLAAIASASRPWLDLRLGGGDDTQPITNYETSIGAGIYLNPLHTLAVVPTWSRYEADASDEPVTGGTLEYGGYWPALRTEIRLVAGGRSHLDTLRFTGSAEAATRIAAGFRASVFAARAPYFHTAASIGQSIMTTTSGGAVTLDRPAWTGEAALRREVYPDDNRKHTAFAWLMRTLIETNAVKLDAGYAFSFEDSEESRFFPVLASAPGPGRPAVWTGRYLPYYTPLDVRTHAVSGALRVQPHVRLTLGAGGSVTVVGREDAPFVFTRGPAPVTGVYDHEIRPWEARAYVTTELSRSTTAVLRVSHLSKIWYDATNVHLSILVRI